MRFTLGRKKSAPSPDKEHNTKNWFTTPYYKAVERRPWLLPPHEVAFGYTDDFPPVQSLRVLQHLYNKAAEKVEYTKCVDLDLDWDRLHETSAQLGTRAAQKKQRAVREDEAGDGLPTDILEKIGRYLSQVDLWCLRAVNRRMRYEVIGYNVEVGGRSEFGGPRDCLSFRIRSAVANRPWKMEVCPGVFSPCMRMKLWKRLENDIGTDKAEKLSCWYCVEQHPRWDFEWDSELHGYEGNLIESEDRICWEGYNLLLSRVLSWASLLYRITGKTSGMCGSSGDCTIINLKGVGRILAFDEGRPVNTMGASIFEHSVKVCSTCFMENCLRLHCPMDQRPADCYLCYKIRRVPILSATVFSGLATRTRMPDDGRLELAQKGRCWGAQKLIQSLWNGRISKSLLILDWYDQNLERKSFPAWWKMSADFQPHTKPRFGD
ncbi:uncharacterized protein LY89DRAFT_739689 [Mollisia scopiformis]|uniref:F-box domain-containing protein n=1 Tax=Mollisia scopiformis TaxID=149040 RepID=A0A194WSU7_MOLSC|nr:uncharacterized protein LY89DRAFT_739689 [Mollisia scopiformis]KUJ10692.1 hypothetical protein LY89DRAFT_739689 [Mollisia scopiformis]